MKIIVSAILLAISLSSAVHADDDTFVKIQEMMNDLGGPANQKKNNGKILKCAKGGTKKIKFTSSGGGTTYSGTYNNCREYGTTRDGNVEISIGGDDAGGNQDSLAVRKGEAYEYYYEDQWDITCKNDGSKCLASSGNIEFSFQKKNGKILGTYGIPSIKKITPAAYDTLNEYFNKKQKPAVDDDAKFYTWMVKSVQSQKTNWSFCNDEEGSDKLLCDFSPNFTAAQKIVDAYNSERLWELVTKYLIQTKYNSSEKNLFLTPEKNSLIDMIRWCAYAPCAAENSIVATTPSGLPADSNMMSSLDLILDLKYLANNNKVDRGTLTDFTGETVVNADEPAMYQAALDAIQDNMSSQLKDIEKAKGLKGSAVDNYLVNWSPVTIAVVAKKLNTKYKLPLDKAYYVASMSLSGIYRNTINSGKVLRHIEFLNKYDIAGINDRARIIMPVNIGKLSISAEEIDGWINELESDVQAKLEADLKLNAHSATALEAMGYLFLNKCNYENGTHFYQKAIDADPQNVDILYSFAWMEKRQGKFNEALAKFDKCITLKPDSADYYYIAGHLCAEDLKNITLATQYFKKFVELEKTGPRYDYAMSVLGEKKSENITN